MFTLDANVFVRDSDPYDPDHATCHALIEQLQAAAIPIIAPGIVLAEVAGGVRRRFGDGIRARLVAELVRALPVLVLVSVDEERSQQAAEIAADYALRGMDAIYVAIAHLHQCTLVTLDREPRERAATLVRVLTPAEALAELAHGAE